MKVLITGATGLIGKKLTQLLIENNISVNYLSTSKDKIISNQKYQGFYWNIKESSIDENCIIGVDAIIHLAGASISNRWTNAYKDEIINSRVNSTDLLFKLLENKTHQVKQIISASGTAIYPNTFEKVLDENCSEIENSYLSNVVLKWEKSVDQFKKIGLKVCKLRTGVVLDKNDGALPQMAKPIKMGFGSSIGSGKQMISWIHIDDIVNMYFFALQNNVEGVFNAVSPFAVTNEEMTKAIAKSLNKKLFLPNVPSFIIKLLLGEMSYLILSSKNLSAKKIQEKGFKFKFPKIEFALENIYKK